MVFMEVKSKDNSSGQALSNMVDCSYNKNIKYCSLLGAHVHLATSFLVKQALDTKFNLEFILIISLKGCSIWQ